MGIPSDVTEYDLVIVGSGILAGKWTKNTLGFLKDNEVALAEKNVAFFVSCGDAFDPEKREKAHENYLVKVANQIPSIKPLKMGLFGGVYNPEKYVFGLKHMMKYKSRYLKTVGADLNQKYDMRDWDQIQNWTQELLDIVNTLQATQNQEIEGSVPVRA
jgi:menaquinone-dependent protoporphyrinogen oxidase